MDPIDFVDPAAGTVRKMPSDYHAFIPNMPPASFDYNRIVLQLSAADAALSELAGLGRLLPNPHLLIPVSIRREATASTRIEGTRATIDDLFLDEFAPELTDPESDVFEIRNYVDAIDVGRTQLGRLPIAGRLVREIHAVLLAGVRGANKQPGEFRTTQNWIGGSGPSNATFVPPPPDDLWRCIGEWERFVNRRGQMPDLVQCALMHAYFETIHPFLDGNGRTGRLLITLFLIERGRLSEPLLYMSTYIENHKADYYAALQRTRTHGDWIGWLAYFLDAVRVSALAAIGNAKALLELRESLRALLINAKKTGPLRLIDELFANPYVSVQRAKQLMGVATDTATKTILTLESLDILHERTGKARGRIWVATPILKALKN